MKPQQLTTLALMAAALGLGGYYLWVDRNAASTSERIERKNHLFETFSARSVAEVLIERGTEQVRVIAPGTADAAGGEYRVVAGVPPREEPADDQAVAKLLQTFDEAVINRSVSGALGDSVTGLSSPRARFTLKTSRGTHTLAIGADAGSPAGATYARIDNHAAVVIPRTVAADLLRSPDIYRSRVIIDELVSDLGRIEQSGAGADRVLVRGPWGGLRVGDTPNSPRMGHAALSQLVDAFANMRVESFLADSEADAAMSATSDKLTLQLSPRDSSHKPIQVVLGGNCPRTPAAAQGANTTPPALQVVAIRLMPTRLSACIPRLVFDSLRMPSSSLVDLHVLDLGADEVEEVKMTRGNDVLELVRKGTGWLLRLPSEREISGADAKGLVEALVKVEGELVATHDLTTATGTLIVRQPASGEQGHPEQKVSLSSGQDGGLLVKREQDGVVLRITRSQARLFEPSPTLLRSTKVLEGSPENVSRVSTFFDDGHKQVLVRTPNGFVFEVPSGFLVDGPQAFDMVEQLANITAERWAAERDDGSFGFSKPRVRVSYVTNDDGGVKDRVLLLGDRTPDGVYARWEPDTGVFVLAHGAEAVMSSYVIDRSVFMLDPSEVKSVRLQGPGHTIVFRSIGDQFESDPAAGEKISENIAAKLRDALIQMRAEGVVHLGDPAADEGLHSPVLQIEFKRVPGRGEQSRDVRIQIGRASVWRSNNVHFARRDGVAATYAIASQKLKVLLDVVAGAQR